MEVHARVWPLAAERTGSRRLRIATGVALALHLALVLASAWTRRTRLAIVRPLGVDEISLQVEETAPAAAGGSSTAGDATEPAAPAEPKPSRAEPRPAPARRTAPSVATPRVVTVAVAPALVESMAPAAPAWSPPNGRMPVPTNSRAAQSASGGLGGEGGGRPGGLFGNGRFVGDGPGALKARVCFIPETTRSVEEFGACEAVHEEFMDVIDVPSRRFEDGFPGFPERTEWFAVTITGSFTVSEPGRYRFRLKSDDGSQLFIDGQLVVDNDGIHDAISKRGDVELAEGRHRILLKYFQGMKFILALQLFVTPPGQPERLFTSTL